MWLLIAVMVQPYLLRVIVGILYLQADRYQAQADLPSAINLLEYAKPVAPNRAQPHNKLGFIHILRGDELAGRYEFEDALAADLTFGPALNNLGVLQYGDHQGQDALLYLARAVESAPDNAQVRYNLGVTLRAQGDVLEAERAYKEASRIKPDWILPHLELSQLYLAREDWELAIRAANQMLELDPQSYPAHLVYIYAQYAQKNFVESRAAAEKALAIFPNDATLKFYEALSMHDLGQSTAALNLLQTTYLLTDQPQLRARIANEMRAIVGRYKYH
ncbi:MAG: tetratricopeptide repeat protein [Caldilineaceae bacterium]